MSIWDKFGTVSKQAYNAAVIVDSKGEKVGSILVRYTDSLNGGYNSQTSILFYKDGITIGINDDRKGHSYDRSDVFYILSEKGAACFHRNGLKINTDYNDKESFTADGMSNVSELSKFKLNRKTYSIHWVA